MYLDAQNRFSNAQAITAAAASTDYIDLSAARNIGVGQELYVVAVVTTAFTDSGSNSTLTVDLYGDSTTSFTPDGTQTLFTFSALSAVGTTKVARISPDLAAQYRYIELYYTPNNGDLSAGALTAFVTTTPHHYTAYADGITIS